MKGILEDLVLKPFLHLSIVSLSLRDIIPPEELCLKNRSSIEVRKMTPR